VLLMLRELCAQGELPPFEELPIVFLLVAKR
jgi:hypothetical protein